MTKTSKSKEPMTLRMLFLMKLSTLYDIENQLLKALPKLADAATDPELAEGFETHLSETEGHVERLNEIFTLLGEKPMKGMESAGIRGIIEDGEWVIKNTQPPEALDAHLIAAASFAEHYEIAGYKLAKEWANLLGLSEIADLLDSTLSEEMAADEKMAMLGEQTVFDKVNS